MASWLSELAQWLGTLDRPFLFLLAVPFMVAVAGLTSHLCERLEGRR